MSSKVTSEVAGGQSRVRDFTAWVSGARGQWDGGGGALSSNSSQNQRRDSTEGSL